MTLWAGGCSVPQEYRRDGGRSDSVRPVAFTQPPPRQAPPRIDRDDPAQARPANDTPLRQAARDELGPEAADALPAQPARAQTAPDQVESREPVDPGAAMIARSIAEALDASARRRANDDGVTIISLSELRNLSRTGRGEFDEMTQRLARLLTRAGRDNGLRFTAGDGDGAAADHAHYRLQGAGYLVTADGFDQWELFLSLAPARRDVEVWNARNAVRLLRTPRPGQPQITYIGQPR